MGKCETIQISFSQEIHGGVRKSDEFAIAMTSAVSAIKTLSSAKVHPHLLNIIGKTKILSTIDNSKILGVGIVGANAGELISEAILAMEMGATIEDIGLTIHPHPTLSETFANAAEILSKTITDLYINKK